MINDTNLGTIYSKDVRDRAESEMLVHESRKWEVVKQEMEE